MITVRYFASIREKLDCADESLMPAAGVNTVNDLIGQLVNEHGEHWDRTLRESSVLVAVNQNMVKKTESVSDGDEVAFFPPVTGG